MKIVALETILLDEFPNLGFVYPELPRQFTDDGVPRPVSWFTSSAKSLPWTRALP